MAASPSKPAGKWQAPSVLLCRNVPAIDLDFLGQPGRRRLRLPVLQSLFESATRTLTWQSRIDGNLIIDISKHTLNHSELFLIIPQDILRNKDSYKLIMIPNYSFSYSSNHSFNHSLIIP